MNLAQEPFSLNIQVVGSFPKILADLTSLSSNFQGDLDLLKRYLHD